MMAEFPSWWNKDGELKLFGEKPPAGWERCAGHYDVERGVWVDDVKEHEPDDVLAALRVEYGARSGKRPFNGWNEDKLRLKIAALKAEGK